LRRAEGDIDMARKRSAVKTLLDQLRALSSDQQLEFFNDATEDPELLKLIYQVSPFRELHALTEALPDSLEISRQALETTAWWQAEAEKFKHARVRSKDLNEQVCHLYKLGLSKGQIAEVIRELHPNWRIKKNGTKFNDNDVSSILQRARRKAII
jgi:hypothetical protein